MDGKEGVSRKVTKSNDLIEAGYKLSLNEQRLILLAVSKIDSRKPMPKGKVTVTALEFAHAFEIAPKHAYEALEDAVNRLYERDIRTFDRTNNIRERFRWVSSVKYHDGEGFVALGFSLEIAPYLTLLHKRFTSYEFKQVAKLGSIYAIRLYELLKQFTETGQRIISLEQFKERLELQDLYPRFFDLKKRVIQPAVDEINAHTDLVVEWSVVRKQREVVSMIFTFESAPQARLDL